VLEGRVVADVIDEENADGVACGMEIEGSVGKDGRYSR
jgi:hypothetical protein